MSTLCLAMYRQVTRRGIAEAWEIYTIPINRKGGRSRNSIFLALMRVLKGRVVKYPMGRHRLTQKHGIIGIQKLAQKMENSLGEMTSRIRLVKIIRYEIIK